jgi:polyhydroxyalkanoate synthase subunit PhaE
MDQQPGSGSESLMESWMKTAAEFWGNSANMWQEAARLSGSQAPFQGTRIWDSWEASAKAWKTFSTLLAEPAAVEGMTKGIHTLPDVLTRVMKPLWEGVFQLQREWMERAGRMGTSAATFTFDGLDREAFKAWSELYEKEFRQFLKMPHIGLLRVYQEHASEALDKFQIFQTAMAEFISLLHLPAEQSAKAMQDKLAEMVNEGHIPEKTKEYYNMWIKILERHYAVLFKSPEYNLAIAKTVDAMSEFLMARKQILEDSLRFLPIPTQQETDELYKEIYLLKKRVKQLEKSKV